MEKHKAPVILIAAVADNGVIGNSETNNLPWDRLEGDLPRFKKLTVGQGRNAVIMGRKTFLSFPKQPLPDRLNVVLSRDDNWQVPEGAQKATSLSEAIAKVSESSDEIYLIGGASVYEEGLQFADQMILTRVHQNPVGDVLFPNFDTNDWVVTQTEYFPDLGYDVDYLQRKNTSVQ